MNQLVAVLRPEPGASATAQLLREAGLEPLVAPLFTIDPIDRPFADEGDPQALMVTSANAARHGAEIIRRHPGIPIYTVGEKTAAALRPLATGPIHIAPGGDARSLIKIVTEHDVTRLLHIAGEDIRTVDAPGLSVTRKVVYRASPVSALPKALIAAWPRLTAAMVHSPRAGMLLDRLTAAARLPRDHVALVAISEAAAQAAATGWNTLKIATYPNEDAMLAVVRQLCQKGADDGGYPA